MHTRNQNEPLCWKMIIWRIWGDSVGKTLLTTLQLLYNHHPWVNWRINPWPSSQVIILKLFDKSQWLTLLPFKSQIFYLSNLRKKFLANYWGPHFFCMFFFISKKEIKSNKRWFWLVTINIQVCFSMRCKFKISTDVFWLLAIYRLFNKRENKNIKGWFWLVTINILFIWNNDFSASWPKVDEWSVIGSVTSCGILNFFNNWFFFTIF